MASNAFTRRLLLQAVKTVQEGGVPRGVNPTYYAIQASEGVLPRDADWRRSDPAEGAVARELRRNSQLPRPRIHVPGAELSSLDKPRHPINTAHHL